MKTIPFLPEHFQAIKNHLDAGYPIIFPTDTCYGFSGSIFSSGAISIVEKIKGRSEKPFLMLCHSFQDVQNYADAQYITKEWQNKALTEPTTFLLKKHSSFPNNYFPDFPEIGIRIPLYLPLLGFLQFYDAPIFSTSANFSGEDEIYTEEEIIKNFQNYPHLLFVTAGDLPKNKPSSIVRIEENNVEYLR